MDFVMLGEKDLGLVVKNIKVGYASACEESAGDGGAGFCEKF